MTIAPMFLSQPSFEFVKGLMARVKQYEEVFRKILVNLADCDEEVHLFTHGTLDEIFDHCVRKDGYETVISDFRIGPFNLDDTIDNLWVQIEFPKFDPLLLKENEVYLLIRKSNDSWLSIYRILDGSSVELEETFHYHQF